MRLRPTETRRRHHAALALLLVLVAGCAARATRPATVDPLPSWNEGPVKTAILEAVAATTRPGSPDFVPPAERIATFDNDGTLWAEQPLYVQFLFAIDRLQELAPEHPEWRTTEPYRSLLAGDYTTAFAGGGKALAEVVLKTHAGITTETFADVVRTWLATARHPRFHRPYTDLVYQPMLELLAHLRAHGFKTFVVSGGEVEFMRAFTERVYDIPPEQVVGTLIAATFEIDDGRPVLMRRPKIAFVDDGAGKPVGIGNAIGRRPLFAFGNSDGDLQMLQYTAGGSGRRFVGIVHHTDAVREWAYDRQSPIGRLDKALEAAAAGGWTIVDMRRDWKRVFPFDEPE